MSKSLIKSLKGTKILRNIVNENKRSLIDIVLTSYYNSQFETIQPAINLILCLRRLDLIKSSDISNTSNFCMRMVLYNDLFINQVNERVLNRYL